MKKGKLTFIRGSSLGTRNRFPHPGPELGRRNIAGAELVEDPVGPGRDPGPAPSVDLVQTRTCMSMFCASETQRVHVRAGNKHSQD